nr:protein TIFY 10A-like [Tanacetum cinerariifolium]
MSSATRNTSPAKRSRVAQTCNQLSSFLKEKSRLKDLINAKFDDTVNSPQARMTIDLLSSMEDQGQKSTNVGDLTNEVTSARSEPKRSQMTIFYNGQVVVFDDVSEDRARDVFLAARSTYGPNLVHETNGLPNHVQFLRNGLDRPGMTYKPVARLS